MFKPSTSVTNINIVNYREYEDYNFNSFHKQLRHIRIPKSSVEKSFVKERWRAKVQHVLPHSLYLSFLSLLWFKSLRYIETRSPNMSGSCRVAAEKAHLPVGYVLLSIPLPGRTKVFKDEALKTSVLSSTSHYYYFAGRRSDRFSSLKLTRSLDENHLLAL